MKCLDKLFVLCGTVVILFISGNKSLPLTKRHCSEKTSPYHPIRNGQCDRYTCIFWKGIRMALRTQKLSDIQWETVLPNVPHSIRSLLSTAANINPHEIFFGFQRRFPCGSSLSTWFSAPGNVMLRRFVLNSKNDPLVDEIEFTSVIQFMHTYDMRITESTVSLKYLSQCPSPENEHS